MSAPDPTARLLPGVSSISYYRMVGLLVIAGVVGDIGTAIMFSLEYMPGTTIAAFTYAVRLLSIVFIFWFVKYSVDRFTQVIRDLEIIHSENELFCTRLAEIYDFTHARLEWTYLGGGGSILVILYSIVIGVYVLPVLGWRVYHPITNALWVFSLGFGLVALVQGMRAVHLLIRAITEYKAVDFGYPDRSGGLRSLTSFLIRSVSFAPVGLGLWLGSVPYAFSSPVILAVFGLGVAVVLLLTIVVFIDLRTVVKRLKFDKRRDLIQSIRQAQRHDSSGSPPYGRLEGKTDELMNLLIADLTHRELSNMAIVPVDQKMVTDAIALASSVLPFVMQYGIIA